MNKMGAIEESKALLDERGVEYELDAHDLPQWRVGGSTACLHEMGVGLGCALTLYPITPEQAIAATLGRGTCHDTGESRVFHCSACGFGLEDAYVEDEHAYPPEGFPRFCPWCGAEVVDE